MHEFSLLAGVIEVVDQATQGRAVDTVALRVGRRSGVIPEALAAAWELARAGTVCAQAQLEIEDIPAAVWCPSCAEEQEIDEYFALLCPACGTPTAQLTRGREFEVAYIDIEDFS